jgi:hypothetical protein
MGGCGFRKLRTKTWLTLLGQYHRNHILVRALRKFPNYIANFRIFMRLTLLLAAALGHHGSLLTLCKKAHFSFNSCLHINVGNLFRMIFQSWVMLCYLVCNIGVNNTEFLLFVQLSIRTRVYKSMVYRSFW